LKYFIFTYLQKNDSFFSQHPENSILSYDAILCVLSNQPNEVFIFARKSIPFSQENLSYLELNEIANIYERELPETTIKKINHLNWT